MDTHDIWLEIDSILTYWKIYGGCVTFENNDKAQIKDTCINGENSVAKIQTIQYVEGWKYNLFDICHLCDNYF